MNSAATCAICQQPSHRADKCPELTKELRPGFYKPSGGRPVGGDEEDEKLNAVCPIYVSKWVDIASSTPVWNTNLYLVCSPQKIF